MFKLAAIATIATFAAAQGPQAEPTKEEMIAMLGPKCTRGTDEEVEKMLADEAKMAEKMKKCDPEKIDDIMCPKKADAEAISKKAMEAASKGDAKPEDAEKMMKEVEDMMKKGMKCAMQCMICENFPDSLSGASTILMGATVAFAGAALF